MTKDLDIDLLNKVVQWAVDSAAGINDEPKHDQRMWARGPRKEGGRRMPTAYTEKWVDEMDTDVCGTSFCLAGDIVAMHGGTFFGYQFGKEDLLSGYYVLMPGSTELEDVSAVAESILGGSDVGYLFGAGHNLAQILKLAAEVAEENGETLSVTIPDGFDVATYSPEQS